MSTLLYDGNLQWLPPPPPPPARVGHGGQPTIGVRALIVDDDRDDAEGVSVLLLGMGAEVRVCHDGRTALAALDEFRPEVGLFDVNMPVMDGCELARLARARAGGGALLLVAVSGLPEDVAETRMVGSGFNLRLPKPATASALAVVLAGFASPRRGQAAG